MWSLWKFLLLKISKIKKVFLIKIYLTFFFLHNIEQLLSVNFDAMFIKIEWQIYSWDIRNWMSTCFQGSIFWNPKNIPHMEQQKFFFVFLLNSGIALLMNKKFKRSESVMSNLMYAWHGMPHTIAYSLFFFSPRTFFLLYGHNNGLPFFSLQIWGSWNYYLIENEYCYTY